MQKYKKNDEVGYYYLEDSPGNLLNIFRGVGV